MDCESAEWAYEGRVSEGKGGLKATRWLEVQAEGKTEVTALRQVSEELMAYGAKWKRLCQSFNSCAISKAAYGEESARMGERLDGVAAAYEIVSAPDTSPDARRVALANAYTSVVPAEQQVGLELTFSVLDEQNRPVVAGQALHTGDRVAFQVRPSAPAHVYLLQKNAKGTLTVLFPDARISPANPLPAGETVRIPPGNTFFRLDDKDIGTETVYIVASLHPVTSMQEATTLIENGEAPAGPVARLAELTATDADNACTRGLELDGDTGEGCVRHRGLQLEGDEPASIRARSEAADDTIIQVFSFEHLKP